MALSAQQVEQYQHDGYVCPVPVMPPAEAAGLRRQLETVEAAQGGKLEAVQRPCARRHLRRGQHADARAGDSGAG